MISWTILCWVASLIICCTVLIWVMKWVDNLPSGNDADNVHVDRRMRHVVADRDYKATETMKPHVFANG